MKAAAPERRRRSDRQLLALCIFLASIAAAGNAATTQLFLTRESQAATSDLTGVVDLTINPGFDDGRVTITVDGQKIAEGLRAPYRVTVDFGPSPVEHKITVVALSAEKRRVQWHTTINRGLLPLTVRLTPVDLGNRIFEAAVTSPKNDSIAAVELWDAGKLVSSVTDAPYRFTVSPELLQSGFVQVTAKTKSGDEAADFWSNSGDVHAESLEVRTVPIFVSVVDRNGVTLDNVDRSLFKVLDNGSETKILEFGKAFDQPISIALLLDASASMTYMMNDATKAAVGFVERTLKQGDRCAIFAIREVPRREIGLTSDRKAVGHALTTMVPRGQTALFDAINTAVRELRDEKNRRAIVVLTDGSDNASIASYEDVEKTARETGIPLYFIAYESLEPSAQKDLDRLKFLAAESGGFVAEAAQHDLAAKYGEIERDLRAQFAIRYQVSDYAKHNEWRRVRVVLDSPKLTARTIGGYFAP
jgi:Ca-activated chloride channel family protein